MANGANGVHLQLREALEDYIKSQYFGKSPILLSQYRINWIKRAFYIKNLISSPHQHIRAN